MVGKTGFEPATPWSQTKCSTKLSHFPIYGALEGIRTPDLLVRSQTLYPAELTAHGILIGYLTNISQKEDFVNSKMKIFHDNFCHALLCGKDKNFFKNIVIFPIVKYIKPW